MITKDSMLLRVLLVLSFVTSLQDDTKDSSNV
jgi:hypothetical protein